MTERRFSVASRPAGLRWMSCWGANHPTIHIYLWQNPMENISIA